MEKSNLASLTPIHHTYLVALAFIFVILEISHQTPTCGTHRPFRTEANPSGRIDRRGISTSSGNSGITENFPIEKQCVTFGFFFRISADSEPVGTLYHLLYFNTQRPYRFWLEKLSNDGYGLNLIVDDGLSFKQKRYIYYDFKPDTWYHFRAVKTSTKFHIGTQKINSGLNSFSILPKYDGVRIPVGSTLYFGSLVNNIDPTITRTIDGILQGLFFQETCDSTNYKIYSSALSDPMRTLGIYLTLDYFTDSYPNLISGDHALGPLKNGINNTDRVNNWEMNSDG